VVGIGSVLSFGLFFVGLGIVGPTRASVLCATEPLTSVLFSLLWLHVTFTAMDALGFALILSTIFLLAKE
jgi:drug/metabolite transporter (DMT)-like permease